MANTPNNKKPNLLELIHKLPKIMQRGLLCIGFLQRSQTYITNMPNMLPMLDKNGGQTDELIADLKSRGLADTKSVFINMGGVILHALYFPPKNGKLVCAFHGIKGNWLNNPPPQNPDPRDTDYNPKYRMVLLEEFANNGFGFLAFSMPGFNPSRGFASEKNFIKACSFFASYAKNLALKSGIKSHDIIVCGESLGGATAAIFAAKLTEKSYAPGVLSMIATFDSLTAMTQNEFPIFDETELSTYLADKLDTAHELTHLNKKETFIHIVAVEGDRIIPLKNTLNLANTARKLGFNVLYHLTSGNHTTWNTKQVVNSKKLTHTARERGIEIAQMQSVEDIEKIVAAFK